MFCLQRQTKQFLNVLDFSKTPERFDLHTFLLTCVVSLESILYEHSYDSYSFYLFSEYEERTLSYRMQCKIF